MFKISSCLGAGFAIVLALDYAAPAAATLSYRDATPALFQSALQSAAIQQPTTRRLETVKQPMPKDAETSRRKPRILVGCDAAFSNLSSYAQLNYASRCLS